MTADSNKLNEITVYFFYRDKSMDCQVSRRALYSILDNYLDKIIMQEINFDHNKQICEVYNVYGVPTLLIIKNNKVVNRYSGILDSREINVLLEPVINSIRYSGSVKS